MLLSLRQRELLAELNGLQTRNRQLEAANGEMQMQMRMQLMDKCQQE